VADEAMTRAIEVLVLSCDRTSLFAHCIEQALSKVMTVL